MKPKIIIPIILIVVGLAVYGYLKAIPGNQDQTAKGPRIEITPESFDFGEIKYGEVAEHTFLVKNSGTEVLEILRLSTSCGCTTAKIAKQKITPSEEVELQVTYDTGVMTGSHAKGEQERIVFIKTNDPASPQVEATISALVID